MLNDLLLCKEFRSTETARVVARMDTHVIDVIVELVFALEAEFVNVFDGDFVNVEHVLGRLNFRRKIP